jgi:hypothetical protein
MTSRSLPLLVAMVCSLASATVYAQNPIPNPGFEDWANGEPVHWTTGNDPDFITVTQTADAHSGSWAVRGDVVEILPGYNAPPLIVSGDSTEGFVTHTQWSSFDGFYKFNSVSGDQVLVTVAFWSALGAVGAGTAYLTTSASTYQPFSVPIFWAGAEAPDSAVIYVIMTGPGGQGAQPHVGSYFQFDDFSFSEGTPPGCSITLTGDVNNTGDRVTSDIIYLVNFVLKGGATPLPCKGAGDVNCDGNVATSDIIYLVNFVLKGGPAPCDACTLVPGTWSCP